LRGAVTNFFYNSGQQLIVKSTMLNLDQMIAFYMLGLLNVSPKVIAIVLLFL
jgi:hypothetical protein